MTRAATYLALTIAASLLELGCNQAAEPRASASQDAAAPLAVDVGKVEVRNMPKLATTLGTVFADRQSQVAANVSGRVVLAAVERGQSVKLGETLMMVDSRAAKLSASAASSQLQLAETQAQQAHSDCGRAEALLAQGAMGQADYERLRTQCKAQELQANAAQAQAALSSKLAADAVIRAPFSGVIGERFVSVGEYVQPPTPVVTIYSLDPVRVVISVPESAVSLVRKGVPVEVQVSAWPGRKFNATVAYVSPALRMMQRDLLVEALAPNPDGALRPGMFATVQVTLGAERVPTVPSDALVREDTVVRLFLVRDGQAYEQVVRPGVSQDDRVAVLEDLADGTLVIRHPPADLHDGMKVATRTSADEPPKTPAAKPTATH